MGLLRAVTAGTVLATMVLAHGSSAADAGDVPSLYVRLDTNVVGTVHWLEGEADRIDATQVLVAFDMVAFAPPPGEHEFVVPDRVDGDLRTWAFALRQWARSTSRPIRAASTLATRSIRMGAEDSADALQDLVRTRWWEGDRVPAIPPALRWVTWFLDRTAAGADAKAGLGPRMLVLVAGRLTPERWVDPGALPAAGRDWRLRLLPVGRYFDEVAVAHKVQAEGAVLTVVAPEVFFGRHEPYPALPALPWASRPRRLPELLTDGRAGRLRGLGHRGDGGAIPAWARRPFPPNLPAGLVPALPPGRDVDELRLPHHSPMRYVAAPTAFFAHLGEVLTQADHTPSGYGWWPYVRAAAATGGRFVFYPGLRGPRRDRLPREEALVDALAPEPVSRAAWLSARRGDDAVHLLATLAADLEEVTPWESGAAGPARAAHGDAWCAYQGVKPEVRLASPLPASPPRLRIDSWASRDTIRIVERIRTTTLPAYDDALARLDALLARIDRGEDVRAHPRAVADLRLARVLVALSAFHLESWALAASSVDIEGNAFDVRIRMLPAIKLSDGLPAPDGRVLGPDREAFYARWVPFDALPDYPGNLLDIPPQDDDYRALRSRVHILRFMRAPLRARALRLIRAARDVVTKLPGTPWAASVYHDVAYVFEVRPAE